MNKTEPAPAVGAVPQHAAVPAPKIIPPEPVAHLVARPRVADLLDRDAPVVLVCAPAGYGKTNLLAAWVADAAARHGRQTAWVHLDSNDADPFRLWSAILAALRRVAPLKAGRLAQLSPPYARMETSFLAAFIDAIDQSPEPVYLVLDDVHRIEEGAAASLDALLRRLPRQLRVVLASRSDPPLDALRQLRLAGRLREIRIDLLAFDRDEAVALLATHGVRLADPDLDLVLARTEGWPAALRLAAMSLGSAADVPTALARVLENDRNVADYLFGEILVHLPEAVHRFLLAISVCDRVTAGLAEALTGQPAADVLDRLERIDALVTRVGLRHHWYRLHSLFRRYLYAELQRHAAAEPLHRTAAVWFDAHDEPGMALEHALASGDSELVVELFDRRATHLLMTSDVVRLRRLLAMVRLDLFRDPRLALLAAGAALDAGDLVVAERHLACAERQPAAATTARSRRLADVVRLRRCLAVPATAASAYELARAGTEDSGDPEVDLLFLANRGMAAAALGRLSEAESDLRQASRLSARGGYDFLRLHCLVSLAGVEASRGEFVQARLTATEVIDFAATRGWARSPRIAGARTAAAWCAWQCYDVAETARHARLAVDLLDEVVDPTTKVSVLSINAALRFEGGDRRRALHDWRAAWRQYGDPAMRPAVIAFTMPVQVRMALALDDPECAAEAIARLQAVPGGEGDAAVLHAAVSLRRGRTDHARRALRPVLAGETPPLAVSAMIHAWLIEAILADASGEGDRARYAAESALDLAAPRQAFRHFVEAWPALRDLLAPIAGQLGQHDGFIAAAARLAPSAGALPEPLTPRERQVLAEFPSMRTVDQMATHLRLAPSTVKTHLRGIYRKLGVGTRRDAVIEARRRGYL